MNKITDNIILAAILALEMSGNAKAQEPQPDPCESVELLIKSGLSNTLDPRAVAYCQSPHTTPLEINKNTDCSEPTIKFTGDVNTLNSNIQTPEKKKLADDISAATQRMNQCLEKSRGR